MYVDLFVVDCVVYGSFIVSMLMVFDCVDFVLNVFDSGNVIIMLWNDLFD